MSIQRLIAMLLVGLLLAAAPLHAQDEPAAGQEDAADLEHIGVDGVELGGHHDLTHAYADVEMSSPAEFVPDLAIFTFIVFLLLVAILLKFAWGPIAAALEQREKNIAGHIAAAETKHEQAKQLLADYEQKLAHAADQVRELLEEARRDAEHTKSEILAEAKAAAQAEHDRAMRDVRNATDAALKQLAETSANLAVDLAGRIVKQRISPEEQAGLIRETLAKLPNGAPSAN